MGYSKNRPIRKAIQTLTLLYKKTYEHPIELPQLKHR